MGENQKKLNVMDQLVKDRSQDLDGEPLWSQ
jgi:hypothetical protein